MIDPVEEMAFKIVQLYVQEVSQRGEKRQMGLDTIINAYFYTLTRLQNKKEEMQRAREELEEREKKFQVEKISFPGDEEQEDDKPGGSLFPF